MTIYKLIAAAFIFLTPIFAAVIVSFFRLNKKGLKFPDLALPLFVVEMLLIAEKFSIHPLLPYYTIIMSLLALVIALLLIVRSESFTYARFFKLFWRLGFFITFLFYVVLVVFIFTI
ncbi:DUF3397 domain-containing protein [Streptococcus halichoeri]|uniref:DUF3397 domain-containing protein n=1 Tax=Streptococcus halichoeri TaxID=254785 RepID=UPI001358708D|nr:DUF3397 domain-containing protein [Streptococcus halichoeri]